MTEVTSGVYTITCTANGRRYVGSSSNIRNRWKAHRSWLRNGIHANYRLQFDWAEYGEEVFEFAVVAEISDTDERYAAEQSLMDLHESAVHGYNRSPSAVDNSGRTLSAEHRQAISDAQRGVPKSEEHRRKLSKAHKANWADREVTPEFREQMAERARMNKGKPKSEETKAKMSAAQKGRAKSPEHLEAIRAAKVGYKPPGTKLNDEKVREIKIRLAAGAQSAALGREYGVSPLTISDIKHGRSWRHVTI
jgi:group I intron endonuclease